MTNKFRNWDIVEYVLGLVAFVSLFLFVHLNMSMELHDPDIWLHIKTGEYIIQHKAIPQTDIFSSTVSGKEWINHSWLAQIIFYLAFHSGGPNNLILLCAIIVLIAFLFLFLSVYKQRKRLSLSVVVLAVAILASKARFNIRPENFSILFFSFYLFLLTRCIRKKWIFLLPLVQLCWVNCHGFFILGPLLVAVFILAEKLKKLKTLPWEWAKTEPLDTRPYRDLVDVLLLVCLVSFLNPFGYKGVFYPFSIIFNSMNRLSIFYRYIQELLPTWRLSLSLILPYYAFIIISLLAFLLNLKRINVAYLLAWLIFLALSFQINRNIIFFNFVAFLTTVDNLSRLQDTKKFNFIEGFFGKSLNLLKYLMLALLILWISMSNYRILRSQYYIFEDNRTKSTLLGVSSGGYPEKAADFILKNNLPDNMFNLFNSGSYLIYRLFPKKRVFIDGRTELYGGEFFDNYQKILNKDKCAINNLFKKFNINTVLLNADSLDIGGLLAYFFNELDWALVYLDEDSMIFVKDDNTQNKTLINKLKVDLKKWQPQKIDFDKLGVRKIAPTPYISLAWMFYYLGFDEQAINEAKEALRILPSAPDAYNIMARIYTKQKLYSQAFEALRLACIYAPYSRETFLSVGDFYMETGKTAEAIALYKKLIKLNPYFPEGHYLLGRSFNQAGNLKLAIKSLRTAIKLNPYSAKYYKELGDLLCKNKDYKRARQVYQDAVYQGLDAEDFYKCLLSIDKKAQAIK
jgi:tetratricopeptide (TPR) repeat protein